jgi:hypothetical protein
MTRETPDSDAIKKGKWSREIASAEKNIVQIDCGARGQVMYVDSDGEVFRVEGITADRYYGEGRSTKVGDGFKQVTVSGDNHL